MRGGRPRAGPAGTSGMFRGPRTKPSERVAVARSKRTSVAVRAAQQPTFRRGNTRPSHRLQRPVFESRGPHHLQTAADRTVAETLRTTSGSASRYVAARNDSRVAVRARREPRSHGAVQEEDGRARVAFDLSRPRYGRSARREHAPFYLALRSLPPGTAPAAPPAGPSFLRPMQPKAVRSALPLTGARSRRNARNRGRRASRPFRQDVRPHRISGKLCLPGGHRGVSPPISAVCLQQTMPLMARGDERRLPRRGPSGVSPPRS